MTKDEISQAAAAMGRKGYRSRLAQHGIEAIRATARENGKLGGRGWTRERRLAEQRKGERP